METAPRQSAAASNDPDPVPATSREPETPTHRLALAGADDAQTIEEPGYGHGV